MKILITGGTGMIGKAIAKTLQNKNHEVCFLGRKAGLSDGIKVFCWDLKKKFIEETAFENVDFIIHLAGANLSAKKWTSDFKKEIYDSRIKGTQTLIYHLKKTPNQVKGVICASAIGFYGNRKDEFLDENSSSENDFLAKVCKDWEIENQRFADELNLRTTILRIGIVLAKQGGALPKMMQPTRWGFGSALGSGKQWMSWIHLEDLANLFAYCIENQSIKGRFNAVSTFPVQNEMMMKSIAQEMKKPFFMPNVPAFVLKKILGQKACLVLFSQKVSNKKIKDGGFQFQFDDLEKAFSDLLRT